MKRRRKLVAIAITVFAVFCIFLGYYFHFGMIGPGLPDSINGWYFPQPTGYDNNGTRMFIGTGSEHYGMTGSVNQTCPPLFPALARDCIQARYDRFYPNNSRMAGQYMVVSWYFADADDYANAEQDLCNFLNRSGNVSDTSLDLRPELQRLSAVSTDRTRYMFTSVPVTQYASDATSGFFISYKKPLLRDRQDYIIMYYGVLNDSDIRPHAPFLTTLMVQGGFPQNQTTISRLLE